MATAKVLLELQKSDSDNSILKRLLARDGHHQVLPSNLDEEQVKSIPDSPGVYYFYGSGQRPLYIGKAKSLKKRVLSHFRSSGSSRRKQLFQKQIRRVEFKVTSDEYFASLLEDQAIKKYWPVYNRAQKEKDGAVAIVSYQDRTGYTRIGLLKNRRIQLPVLAWFNSMSSAKTWLYRAFLEFKINPKRAGFPISEDFEAEAIQDDEKALDNFVQFCQSEYSSTYALVNEIKRSYVLVKSGLYKGFGKLPENATTEINDFESNLSPAPDSPTVRAVLRHMLSDDRIQKVSF